MRKAYEEALGKPQEQWTAAEWEGYRLNLRATAESMKNNIGPERYAKLIAANDRLKESVEALRQEEKAQVADRLKECIASGQHALAILPLTAKERHDVERYIDSLERAIVKAEKAKKESK